ncbi:ABC transporter permease [Parabacteroides chinchillae]|uniref:Putative ABC transport system permease protein n=1 Tax=Parabacteroides chinchillae TaxID=871327 RepID=A0A8G2F2Y4_9BACT|nr:ABC transporter permease [Parabacteroides chinchillae]SEF39833.1 putative ABC transport system permease protein [Parabacteroides chinchillae]
MNNLLNLKAFAKFMSHNKAYTAIDIFGLSVSLMFVLLIAVYTVQEISTDSRHTKANRIYLVGNENWIESGAAMSYKIKDRYPEVEKVCPVMCSAAGEKTKVVSEDKKLNADLMFADSTFFDFFDFPLLKGDRNQVLSARNYAVVSSSFARKMFGADDPVGKPLLVGDTISAIISGVIGDMRHSSLPEADVILRWEQMACFNSSLAPDALNNAGATVAFVMVRQGSNFPSRAAEMAEWMKTFYWPYEINIAKEAKIVSLKNFYFSGLGSNNLHTGDKKFVLVLMSIGILILIFAVINYINLTVAQAGFRAKEMATRRLLGSSRGELFLRLMQEATLLTFISMIIAILLALAAVPFVNDLLRTKLDLSVLFTLPWLLSLVGVLLVVGGLSGLLPSLIISASKPIEVVRGTFRAKTKMVFSKFFIVFQNVITIAMIAASILMVEQILHLIHAPLGYKMNNQIAVVTNAVKGEQYSALVNEFRRLPFVKAVGKTRGIPLLGANNNTATLQGKVLSWRQFVMDKECMDILGLKILRDNHLAGGDGWYVSQFAFKEMNLPEDTPSVTFDNKGWSFPIAGTIQDFQFGDVTRDKVPIMFRFLKDDEQPWAILVETQGDIFTANKELQRVYEKVIGLEAETCILDEELQKAFDSQIRLAKIVIVFSVIAVLISLLGLVAMSTYFIQQRSKEVAVRKVFGSTNKEILIKLVRTFMIYVGVAFVVAVPIIYHFGNDWLSNYSYRIALNPLIFIAAGLFCFVISFAAVFVQSWRAANTDPVESFRKVQQ